MGIIWKQSSRFNAPETLSKQLNASKKPSEVFSLNHKVNFNHEALRINDSHLDKSISMTVVSSVTEISSSFSSNPRTKSLLVSESSSFKKDYEAKSSKKGNKEEKIKETSCPSSEKFENSASENARKPKHK